MIKVHYSDESLGEYDILKEAEADILACFSNSDNMVTPEYVEEVDDKDEQVAVFSCDWSVELIKCETEE